MRAHAQRSSSDKSAGPAPLARSMTSPDTAQPQGHYPVALDLSGIPVRTVSSPLTIQAKLTVGGATDDAEHEADSVADRVMNMPTGGVRPVVRADADRGRGMHAPQAVHDVLRTPGRPLDDATRAFFEPRFGRDFSGVRVHTDAGAAQAARTIGAQAFAAGSQLVFAQGRYAPGTKDGRRLLSHELAHVVQQGAGAQTRIRMKPGDEFPFADNGTNPHAMGSFDTATGVYTVQADKTVYADQTAAYDTLTGIAQRFETDVDTIVRMNGLDKKKPLFGNQKLHIQRPTVGKKLSSEISTGMSIANTPGNDIEYPEIPLAGTVHPDGFLNTGFWEEISEPGSTGAVERKSWNFRLKSGKSATEGIDAVFNGPTRLECLSMTSAVMARAVRQTIGQKRFDKAFGESGKTNQTLVIGTSDSSEFQTSKLNGMIKSQAAGKLSNLKKGDWVYFWNCKQYHVVHPTGAWGGENAIYEGGGYFSGFGASRKNMDAMEKELWGAYNSGLTKGDGKYMEFDEWKKQKNEDGGDVGIDWSSVYRLDAGEVEKLGK